MIGDTYTVELKESHLAWGTYRNPTNREIVPGEGYVPIPFIYATKYKVFNSNSPNVGIGYNEFFATSYDGYLKNTILLAQGSKCAGDIYAKQFSVKGDLKVIGAWYRYCNARPGNRVTVTWLSPTNIMLKLT